MSTSRKLSFDWALWFLWIMGTTLGWFIGAYVLPGFPALMSGVLISMFQWAVLYKRIPKAWHWAIASSIGWAVGWVMIVIWLPPQLDFLAGLLISTTTGIAQWLVLRKIVYWSGWWIPVSIVGWTTGLTFMPGVLTSGALPGAITGIALTILLHYAPKEPLQEMQTSI